MSTAPLRLFAVSAAFCLAFAASAAGEDPPPPAGVRASPQLAESLASDCEAGETLACARLGVLYRHGRGVGRDHARALTLFVRACEAGSDFACGYAGEMTFQGLGIESRPEQGEKLMRRACARGDGWSCRALARHGLSRPEAR